MSSIWLFTPVQLIRNCFIAKLRLVWKHLHKNSWVNDFSSELLSYHYIVWLHNISVSSKLYIYSAWLLWKMIGNRNKMEILSVTKWKIPYLRLLVRKMVRLEHLMAMSTRSNLRYKCGKCDYNSGISVPHSKENVPLLSRMWSFVLEAPLLLYYWNN